MSNLRLAAYGLILWLVPFVCAIPLMGADGVPWVGIFLFKSIMLIVGSWTGLVLLRRAFMRAGGDYVSIGIRAAVVWTVMQWAIDAVVLLPMSGMGAADYVEQIGLRYLSIALLCIYGGRLAREAAEASPSGPPSPSAIAGPTAIANDRRQRQLCWLC